MKNSKSFLKTALLGTALAFTVPTFAQIEVESDGRVNITESSSSGNGHLNVLTQAFHTGMYISSNQNTTGTKYGINSHVFDAGTGNKYGIRSYVKQNSSASSSRSAYGLYSYVIGGGSSRGYGLYNNISHNSAGTIYGTYNTLSRTGSGSSYATYNRIVSSSNGFKCGSYNYISSTGTGNNYGIYSYVVNNTNGNSKSGYFAGDVVITGTLTNTSDLATKQGISKMTNALALVSKLQPKTYEYKDIEALNLPKGKQYGFIAQELEAVIPELVKEIEVIQPDEIKEKTTLKTIKSVNYTGLTPVLVKAVQEQQAQIEQQQKLIEALEARLAKLEQQ